MQVFPGVRHCLLSCLGTEPCDERFLRFLFLLLRTEGERGIPFRMREREQRGKQRDLSLVGATG